MATDNLLQLFENACRASKGLTCFRFKKDGVWRDLTWSEVRNRVQSVSAALEEMGIHAGDAIAILSYTRPEWTIADLAILSLGAITVPIYHSNMTEEIYFICENAEVKGIFVENEQQLAKLNQVRGRLPNLKWVILMSGKEPHANVLLMDRLYETSPKRAAAYQSCLASITRETVASYVYTSGTTGQPKGAVLTHGNFLAAVTACKEVITLNPDEVSLFFLPLAHILARVIQFYQIGTGYIQAYAESIEKLAENMREVKPHFIVSVPRIFEKVYERIMSQVNAGSPMKKKLFDWSLSVGRSYARTKLNEDPPPVAVSLQYLIASRLVFKKIRDRLGGRMRFAISGGAPLSKEIAEFFHVIGIEILEGYGLTETSAAINCNYPGKAELGTVGPTLNGSEEKIADDGEILVRGEMVFKGYYKNPDATREVIDSDGWFHTGDIGEFTEKGNLKITDRKKDIIVTAGGKNIAPQKIENMLKNDKYVSQAVVHGDKRKYLTALITLNWEEVEKTARADGFYGNGTPLFEHPKTHELVRQIIERNNRQLPKYETIKRFTVLENDLTQEAGELTPTLKIKRRFIEKKYASELGKLYQEHSKDS
jgi:long-chain acyl-CoA synthetase